MTTQRYNVIPGTAIYEACDTAIKLARQQNCNVEFEFNGQKLTATPETQSTSLMLHFDISILISKIKNQLMILNDRV